ncbi:LLM class flavin-dependent oxidoreductase [Saliphagus sp. LR7]|uniref:LLM class flavin-dependent oxidoreductase n=1 Tax=Saliphagus sp. LR7 TaxID=2282654 RepID=UPI0013001B09|nr:LLM class flavin-dependent oxidoreductase [Saliphagus sp. LR7]
MGAESCRYACRYADHLITAAGADVIENQILPNYESGLEEADRSLSDVDVTAELAVNVGDPDEVVAQVRERGEHVLAGSERYNPDPRSIQRIATN